jgi:hypothetical protein
VVVCGSGLRVPGHSCQNFTVFSGEQKGREQGEERDRKEEKNRETRDFVAVSITFINIRNSFKESTCVMI